MTEQQHPITPPPELRRSWFDEAQRKYFDNPSAWVEYIAEKAAQWGADQELEACCVEVASLDCTSTARHLREIRRPKLPSLKELALDALTHILNHSSTELGANTIRRALETLPDD